MSSNARGINWQNIENFFLWFAGMVSIQVGFFAILTAVITAIGAFRSQTLWIEEFVPAMYSFSFGAAVILSPIRVMWYGRAVQPWSFSDNPGFHIFVTLLLMVFGTLGMLCGLFAISLIWSFRTSIDVAVVFFALFSVSGWMGVVMFYALICSLWVTYTGKIKVLPREYYAKKFDSLRQWLAQPVGRQMKKKR